MVELDASDYSALPSLLFHPNPGWALIPPPVCVPLPDVSKEPEPNYDVPTKNSSPSRMPSNLGDSSLKEPPGHPHLDVAPVHRNLHTSLHTKVPQLRQALALEYLSQFQHG